MGAAKGLQAAVVHLALPCCPWGKRLVRVAPWQFMPGAHEAAHAVELSPNVWVCRPVGEDAALQPLAPAARVVGLQHKVRGWGGAARLGGTPRWRYKVGPRDACTPLLARLAQLWRPGRRYLPAGDGAPSFQGRGHATALAQATGGAARTAGGPGQQVRRRIPAKGDMHMRTCQTMSSCL